MNFKFITISISAYLIGGTPAFSFELSAPDSTGPIYFLGANYHRGIIITDSPSMTSLATGNPRMIQVDFGVLKNTQQAWNYCNCYSKSGVSLSFTDFRNPRKLGTATSLVLFAEPYLYFSEKIQASICGYYS